MRSVLPFIVTLLGVASAVPSPRSDHVMHETRISESSYWTKTGRLNSNKVLPMRFGLIQQNLHRLEEMLMSVSHPESPKYAQHFTSKEVVDIFAPSKETISAITNWLVDSGFSRDRLRLSLNKGWIHLNASTSEVENLLNTEYHVYTHISGDTQIGEDCPYVRPKQMILFTVSRVPQLFSTKTSPTARRSHPTYCTSLSPTTATSSKCSAKERPGSTLLG
jgi:subtilase family serine protease